MKILVTGGTVFASKFTAEYFVKNGCEVYVINRNTLPQSNGVKLICCDRHKLGSRLKDIYFDLVLDITAYTGEDVSDLIDALGEFGQYILISSSAVYPETNTQPFQETQAVGENIHWGDYGINKITAEKVLLEKVPNSYILRPPYLYGVMNNLYREAFVFDCAERNMPFYVPKDGKMPLQFIDIEDMCRFIEKIIEKNPNQNIFNIGNSDTITIEEWVKLCYKVVGKIPVIKYVSEDVPIYNYFPFRDYAYKLDVTAMKLLMNDEKPLENGLKQSYDWYKNNKERVRRKDYISYINSYFKLEDL